MNSLLFLVAASLCTATVFSIGIPNSSFLGEFENLKYTGNSKNNWHYVTITYEESTGTYKWTNRDGRQWTLYPTDQSDTLRVGKDCPHYKNGHTFVVFTVNDLRGPHNELYTRKVGNAVFIGDFENHKHDNGGKNNWHYVSITFNEQDNTYTWTNKARRSWTLYPQENKFGILRVGTDCPYYLRGYTEAVYNEMGIYGVGNEFYTKTEEKPWFIGRYKNNGVIYIVTYQDDDDSYLLTKPNGATCVMYATNDPELLKISSTCEDYNSDFKVAKFNYKGMTWKDDVLYSTV